MKYQSIYVKGIRVFYRECGDSALPTMVLFHGFPSSSHMFRDLMLMLEEHFHLIAPDYPGFGQSESPSRQEFAYTFDHLAEIMEAFLEELKVHLFYMYVFDYGAPIGFRIACRHPDQILGIISQNGNVYEEGLGKKWEDRAIYWKHPTPELREQYKNAFARDIVIGQYTFGTEEGSVSPDGYSLDFYYASLIPDYAEKQSDLIFDYQTNIKMYPVFQEYLRTFKPELLAVWGKNDPSFIWAGAEAFRRDLPDARIVPIESGHFALENCCREIADHILDFFIGRKGELLEDLKMRMIEWECGCPKRIQHFLKVHSFARTIALGEQADEHTLFIIEALGYIHDIGIKIAIEKEGTYNGQSQEFYGEPAARTMLLETGFSEEDSDRISMIVGKHHTYNAEIDGMDFQILLEADACVNMFEKNMPVSAKSAMLKNVFRTETGKNIYKTMFEL